MKEGISCEFRYVLLHIVLVLLIFISAVYIPFIGQLVSVLTPVPLTMLYLQCGPGWALSSIVTVFFFVSGLWGVKLGAFFVIEYGIMSIALAMTIQKGLSIEKIVMISAMASLCTGLVLYSAYLGIKQINPWHYTMNIIEENFQKTLDLYKTLNVSAGKEITGEQLGKTLHFLRFSFPAILIVETMITGIVNFGVLGYTLGKKRDTSLLFIKELGKWSIPENFIWFLICAGAFSLIPITPIQEIGINLLIISLFIYFLQGIAIARFFLERYSVTRFFRWLLYILFLTQPPLLIIVLGLGVFNLWFDFRRIKE